METRDATAGEFSISFVSEGVDVGLFIQLNALFEWLFNPQSCVMGISLLNQT